MKLIYTGAIKPGALQTNSDLSLGGFTSSSEIPNDMISNLFSAASMLSIQDKRRETKLIAIKNDNGSNVSDIKFKFLIPEDSICKYKVAFVYPSINTNSVCFEKIQNSGALPYHANFILVEDELIITIPNLDNNKFLGVWISREYDYTSKDLKKKTDKDWLEELLLIDANDHEPIEPNTREEFSFELEWVNDSSNSNSNSNSTSNSNS